MHKVLKFGVLGARRGSALARGARANGVEITALCDQQEEMASLTAAQLGNGCKAFFDFAEMLKTDIDAVMIANYATEHLWAVKMALAAGKHVMSECMACFTMAEAVELVEAVERSGCIYMLAENYPFFVQNLEMKRLYETGEFGKFVYGEGEYVHPITAHDMVRLSNGPEHWRNWFSPLYYCTHSMGPIMNITGTRPVSVNGFVFPYDDQDSEQTMSLRRGDQGGVLMCRMADEAIVKLLPWSSLRDHGQRYRICCNKGTLEWNQGDPRLRVHVEPFDKPESPTHNQWYTPNFPSEHQEALKHGHGGGDYFTSYYFCEAIRTGKQPFQDVYRAVDMTVIGIQGYRSALNNNNTYEIPDFHDPAARDQYRHDDWNHDPKRRQPGMPFGSIRGNITPSPEALAFFQKEKEIHEQEIRKELETLRRQSKGRREK